MNELNTIEQTIIELEKTNLSLLIHELLNKSADCRKIVLNWMDQNKIPFSIQDKNKQYDIELDEYWGEVEEIIAEFNEYGGGPEEREDEAYDWLDKIEELLKNKPLSSDWRLGFVDEAMYEYRKSNSGFEDRLLDLCFMACKNTEDWEYLIEELKKSKREWDEKKIMLIYRDHLYNEAKYLQYRLTWLKFGLDYWDLVQYYEEQKNQIKAIEYAEHGIKKGEGRIDELYEYLRNIASKTGDKQKIIELDQYWQKKNAISSSNRKTSTNIKKKKSP